MGPFKMGNSGENRSGIVFMSQILSRDPKYGHHFEQNTRLDVNWVTEIMIMLRIWQDIYLLKKL